MPGLKHQYSPKQQSSIARTFLVLRPQASHFSRFEKPFLPQPLFVQIALRPIEQGTPQPPAHGRAETHLWALRHFARNTTFEDRSQRPFGSAVTLFDRIWNLGRKLD